MATETTSESLTGATEVGDAAAFVPPGPGQWMLDTTHHGRRPSTRFMAPINAGASAGFEALTARYGLPLQTMDFTEIHGYTYARPRAIGDNGKGGAPPPTPVLWLVSRLHPELRRRNRAAQQAWAERRWRDDVDDWFDRGGREAVIAVNLRLQRIDPAAIDDAALADHLEELAVHLAEQFVLGFATHGGDIVPCGDYLAHCADWGISVGDATALLAGASPLTVEVRDLIAPAARVLAEARSAGEAPGSIAALRARSVDAAAAIDRWLELHGWRLLNSDDVDCPTLAERPDLQWRVIAAADIADDVATTPDPSAIRACVPADERARFDQLLAEARYGLRLRDDNVGVRLNWPAGLARRALLEVGRRLTERGSLDDPTHAFHCTADELAALLRGGEMPTVDEVRRRDAERVTQLSLDAPSYVGPDEPPPPVDAFPAPMARATRAVLALIDAMQGSRAAAGDTLVGHGIGGAAYQGRAVVIDGPEGDFDAICEGDVLIAPFTSPSFNSVFPLLGAVAVEEGGLMSHTAIVSREFGVPAVVGVAGVLDAIRTGDRVEVDPSSGTVRRC